MQRGELVRKSVWLAFAGVVAAIAIGIAYSVLRALLGDNPIAALVAFLFIGAAVLFLIVAVFFSSGPDLGDLLRRGKKE